MLKKILLFLAIAASCYSCTTNPANNTPTEEYVKVGSSVPAFSVAGESETTFSSPEDFNVKTTLLMFFTTWCSYCKKQMPAVEETQRSFKDNPNVQIICIARGGEDGYVQTPAMIRQYWEENNFSMKWYIDPDRKVFDMFAESEVPRFYLIDTSGKVIWQESTFKYTAQQFADLINKYVS